MLELLNSLERILENYQERYDSECTEWDSFESHSTNVNIYNILFPQFVDEIITKGNESLDEVPRELLKNAMQETILKFKFNPHVHPIYKPSE